MTLPAKTLLKLLPKQYLKTEIMQDNVTRLQTVVDIELSEVEGQGYHNNSVC